MAIETIDNFGVFVGKNIDSRYGPYANTTEANLAIDSIFRFKGLTVLLTGSGTQIEYWYYNGITDPDLVPKTAAVSISGSDGQVVFYSGSDAISGSPNFTFNYTSSIPIFNISGAISASYGNGTVGFYGTASWAQNAISASYALHGGDVTQIIAGTNITISPPEGTGSVTINASAAAGSGLAVTATASFTNLSVWNFTHNLQSRYVVIQALDLNHQQIIPETIELLDTMSARLTFPTPESGYAIASIGGITASYALTASSVITNNGGTIYSSGTDLIIDPVSNLIISGNMIPGPPYTANTSSYNLGSPTAAWNHLYVANGSIVFITGSNTADLRYTGTHITATKPFSGSFTGSLFGIGSSSFSGSIILTGSLNITGSTTQTGNNNLIGNTILSGSIGISGSSIIQGITIMSGSLNISGSTTQRGNNTLEGITTLTGSINISGDIIPTVSKSFDLGSETNPWRSLYVQSGSISIQSDTIGGPSAIISNTDGNVSIAAAGFQVKSGSSTPFIVSPDGSVIITGSLKVSGSLTEIGNTTITGSLRITGSGYINGLPILTSANTSSFTDGFGWYGAFCSTGSQTNPVGNVSRSMQLDTVEHSNGVSVVNGSRITFAHTGVYNIQFSAQLESTAAGDNTVDIWFKKNGTNVARSNTLINVAKQAGDKVVAAWNYVDTANANDYYEIVWQAADIHMQLLAATATGNIPATPSVIVTATQVG